MTIEEAIKWCESRYQGAIMPGATEAYKMCLSALRAQQEAEKNPGEVSDGYHTFNELYHHRAVLFSVICNEHFDLAWKSKHHADGSMYDGMFIVGIETPDGPATYHYDVMPYWDMFHVKELDKAPEWDGHTPDQAIERIGSLGAEKNEPTRCMDCVNWKPGETMGGIKTGQIERLGECKFIRGAFMATDFCSRAKCRQKEAHNV